MQNSVICNKSFIASFTDKYSQCLVSQNSTLSFKLIPEYCGRYRAASDSQESSHRLLWCSIKLCIITLRNHQLLLL